MVDGNIPVGGRGFQGAHKTAFGGVVNVALYVDQAGVPVEIAPLQAARLARANAGIVKDRQVLAVRMRFAHGLDPVSYTHLMAIFFMKTPPFPAIIAQIRAKSNCIPPPGHV